MSFIYFLFYIVDGATWLKMLQPAKAAMPSYDWWIPVFRTLIRILGSISEPGDLFSYTWVDSKERNFVTQIALLVVYVDFM